MKIRILIFILMMYIPSASFAALLLPELYIGGAYAYDVTKLKYTYESSNGSEKSIDYALDYPKGAEFVVGIKPIPTIVPILSGLRLELQAGGLTSRKNKVEVSDFNAEASDKSNFYGTAIYLDLLTFIPIVNPYIGYGYRVVNHKINSTIAGYEFDTKFKSNMQYLAVGLNFSIPFLPLTIYLETMYGKDSAKNKSYSNIASTQGKIGVKYSFFGS